MFADDKENRVRNIYEEEDVKLMNDVDDTINAWEEILSVCSKYNLQLSAELEDNLPVLNLIKVS